MTLRRSFSLKYFMVMRDLTLGSFRNLREFLGMPEVLEQGLPSHQALFAART